MEGSCSNRVGIIYKPQVCLRVSVVEIIPTAVGINSHRGGNYYHRGGNYSHRSGNHSHRGGNHYHRGGNSVKKLALQKKIILC